MDIISWPDAPGVAVTVDELLARADALRDSHAWAEAAAAYADVLRLRPEAWALRVQFGHCIKEAGDPEAALRAYREAEFQQPEDADIHLQIGHVLKRLDRRDEAVEEYARALMLDPGNASARAEVMALDPAPPEPGTSLPPPPSFTPRATAGQPTGVAEIVFDASDLLDYFQHNRAPTGIQRVQLNIIREALGLGPGSVVAGFDPVANVWKAVPRSLFDSLVALSRDGTSTTDPAWREALAAVREVLRDGPPLGFATGCSLVNLGTSWWIPDYLRVVRDAKARHGLRYIPFIHDCIPLLVPEHCAANLVDDFARWFAALCLHADAVLTNSKRTQADFIRLLHQLLPDHPIPCYPVPLDAADQPAAAPAPMRRPYVLFVGTIESRKNHLLAFGAWLALLRKHGAEAVPDLVCVGKRGWLAETALLLHQNSAALRAKVHLLHGVSDTELETLYRGCLFTLYNSFYEGWGLPVTESLAHGKVPLVPDHSSLREAGGTGAVFFTPQSEPDLIQKLEQLLFEPGFRSAQEARVAAAPAPRTWAAVAGQVLAAVRQAAETQMSAPRERLAFGLGEVHVLRLLPGPEPSLSMAIADVLREGPGWSRLEDWGVWALPGQSLLRLPLQRGLPKARLRIYLELLAPPQPSVFRVRAQVVGGLAGIFRTLQAAAGEALFCMLDIEASGGNELEVEFETGPGVVPTLGDPRLVGIGLRSMMVCRWDDLASRLDYLERAALPRLLS